jgi:LETM1 and EF-hand domain-containing protein 1
MKKSRNKKKKMRGALREKPTSWRPELRSLCYQILRFVVNGLQLYSSVTTGQQLEPQRVDMENARMTHEQLKELSEALSVLSTTSSVLKERGELRSLMEENLGADEDPKSPSGALTKRIRGMLTRIDKQLEEYDSRVGNSLQMISADAQGRISVQDLEKALAVIKHKPDEEVGQAVVQKLDVDKDGFVELEHVLELVREEGLGKSLA